MNHRSSRGRTASQLLADAGHDTPHPTPVARPPADLPAGPRGGLGFRGRRGSGWNPASVPVSQWRMTSDQTGVLWPFINGPTLPAGGATIGIDEFTGGAFHCDPNGWVINPHVPVTNANLWILGKPGRGKSATIKALLLRLIARRHKALILGDIKDEYETLARALGVEPFIIGPGHPTRINPLDFGPLGRHWDGLTDTEQQARADIVFGRWLTVIRGLVGSQKIGERHVPYGPSEDTAVQAALAHLTGRDTGRLHETTIPELWDALHHPDPALIDACRYADIRDFLDQTRLLRDALGALVRGPLAGMFDTHTSINVDWDAPLQTLSLSRLRGLGDDATGIALTCLNSWGRGLRELAPAGERRLIVRDEVWRQLRLGPAAIASFDADLRLSRADGDIHIAATHKPSDLHAGGHTGSQAAAIAKDLLHLADTRILHGQDPKVSDELDQILDLGPIARDLITGWALQAPGRALWLVGDRTFKVLTILHPLEQALYDTNTQLKATP